MTPQTSIKERSSTMTTLTKRKMSKENRLKSLKKMTMIANSKMQRATKMKTTTMTMMIQVLRSWTLPMDKSSKVLILMTQVLKKLRPNP